MADRAEVPPNPVVTISVDAAGRITINGHDVAHSGTVDPRQVATEVVCSDFAQPLGRPVRAVANLPHEQVAMVIHPDGRVSDVERHRSATPAGVPPATRVRARLGGRDADPVSAEVSAARHAGRRRRRPMVVGAAAAVAAGVAVVLVSQQPAPPASDAVAGQPPNEAASAEVAPPAQAVQESAPIRPVAVSGVRAAARPGQLRLSIAAARRTPARVVVTRVAQPNDKHLLDLSIRGETARLVTVSDLAPGHYRWVVLVPGQPRETGVTRVPAVPEPAETVTDTVPVTYDPPPTGGTNDTTDGMSDGGGDGRSSRDRDRNDRPALTGVSTGPTQPVDPDGD